MTRRPLVLALLFALPMAAFAADDYPIKVYPCPQLEPAPTIDGELSDPCWAKAPVVSGFTRYNKPELVEVQASFRVGYDSASLYFAIHCDEPKAAKLVLSHEGRDSGSIFHGEAIELFIDPGHTHKDYFQFGVNVAGSLFDGKGSDTAWNSAARLATKIVADGWDLEMAIPWRDLGVEAPRPGLVVGFNVCRDRYAGGAREWSNWAQTKANFHDAARFAHLVLSPTEEMLGKLAGEFRKGDRRGAILLYGEGGRAGKAYLAMAREALAGLEKELAGLKAEADKELDLSGSEEVAKCLETAKALLDPYRARLAGATSLDAAEWSRMSVGMSKLGDHLRSLLWDARLAMLLKKI